MVNRCAHKGDRAVLIARHNDRRFTHSRNSPIASVRNCDPRISLISACSPSGIQMMRSLPTPRVLAALLIPIILGAAMISALGPAESAVRGRLVEALEYE